MNRYPDMGSAALYADLAARLDVPVGDLAAATGSVALIYQLLAAYCEPGDEVVHAWRSFEATRSRSPPPPPRRPGAADRRGPPRPRRDGRRHHRPHPRRAAVHPQQPTGPALTQGEVDAFLAKVPAHVLVVLDEAYLEFVRLDPSRGQALDAIGTYRRHDNVVVFRTFSKAYGLAGFRVGYAVAHAEVAAALRAVSLPFGVSAVAQAAAIASLEAQPELLERGGRQSSRSASAWSRASPRSAGTSPTRRATSSGSTSARRPPPSPRPPTPRGSWSARSRGRAAASPSGSPRPTRACSRSPRRSAATSARPGVRSRHTAEHDGEPGPERVAPPDLDALADRLEAASRRRAEPVEPHHVRSRGQRSYVVRLLLGALVVVATMQLLGSRSPLTAWVAVPLVLLPLVLVAAGRGRSLFHVDDGGLTVPAAGTRPQRHWPWSELLEVGWVPDGHDAVLVLRPAAAAPRGGADRALAARRGGLRRRGARRRACDRLLHACGRHGVHFSEDRAALGTAPPGSPYR